MSGRFIKKYWPLVAAALLVGLFSIAPLFLSLQRMGDSFQGIWPQFNSDANFYLSRMHEVEDGHPDMNNPYFAEHKDAVYPQATGAERFVAFLSQALGVSIPGLQAVLAFITPALMAALMYLLLMMLYPNRLSAFVLSAVFFTVVTGGMTKPIHPGISFPLLLLFLLSWFYLVFKKERQGIYTVLCGVFLGLLFLTYFFHWSFLFVVLGVYGLTLLVKKDYGQLKRHVIIVAIALAVGAPFLVRALAGVDAPFYEDMALRQGVFATHWPETFPRLTVALAWLGVFVFLTRHYRLNHETRSHVLLSLLIANVVYPNHQIITGITIENANHWSLMPVFLYALSGHYLVFSIRERVRRSWSALNAAILGVVAIMFVIPSWRLYTFNFPPYQRSLAVSTTEESQQKYADVLQWIDNNTFRDSVIFSHLAFMRLVPVYTHANVYYTESAPYLLVSDTEVIERTLLALFFDIDDFAARDFGMGDVPRILWTQPAMIERNTHWLHDRLNINYELQYTLERELELVRSVYADLAAEGWDSNLLQRYRLDYIVWDKELSPEWNLDAYSELTRVYDQDGIGVFVFSENQHGT